MEANQYLQSVISNWKEEASRKRYSANSNVSVDWGELELLINKLDEKDKLLDWLTSMTMNEQDAKRRIEAFLNQSDGNATSHEEVVNCFACNKPTLVTHSEQQKILLNEEVAVKCKECILEGYADMKEENKELPLLKIFIEKNGLEEEYEYFFQEQKNNSIF